MNADEFLEIVYKFRKSAPASRIYCCLSDFSPFSVVVVLVEAVVTILLPIFLVFALAAIVEWPDSANWLNHAIKGMSQPKDPENGP